MKTYNHQRKLE